jgi:hypothetical protein
MRFLLGFPWAMLIISVMLFRRKNEKDLFLLYSVGSVVIALVKTVVF